MRHGIFVAVALAIGISLAGWLVPTSSSERNDSSSVDNHPSSTADAARTDAPARLVVVEPVAVSTDATDTVVTTTIAAPPPSTTRGVEATGAGEEGAAFFRDINELRTSRGVAPLTRRTDLDAMAQAWVETMSAEGVLRHSNLIHDVVAESWSRAGENVGYGPTEAAVLGGLEASAGHLANMVDPNYTAVGIGAVRIGERLWTAHLFAG